ncbi:MHYT domain-containing protein [Sagittula sp. NFXS13]|uniref:MHYT domain-containing protein n=1 Tax=Sagittula sp. NFXS13 TaxID=2819095 RepID=UPI0032DEE4D4
MDQTLLEISHNAWLVMASLAIALMAGFSGLSLTRGASRLPNLQRKMTLVIAAIVLGGGIWSMHFVAMLGLELPIRFYYDGLMTLISALIAILMMGLALLILHFRNRTAVTLTTAGSIMGLGIAAMHYVGMLGMELCAPVFGFTGVAVSVLSALLLSNLAIWVAYGARTRGNTLLGTVCFAVSVGAVHYIAMTGTGFVPNDAFAVGPEISNEVMAMGVTVTAFVISGAFLLTGVSFLDPVTEAVSAPAVPEPHAPADPGPESEEPSLPPVPFEKEGRTQFLDRKSIAAVRAEGHYTLLYAGSEKLFCPWSISEAESRLAPSHFIRSHRSYLINPSFVTGFERKKDTGVCLLASTASLQKVPVSRSRLSEVRSALGI